MRTINVTGNASIAMKADLTNVYLRVYGVEKQYSQAIKVSTDKSNKIIIFLTSLGFKNKDIKTKEYSINEEYEGHQKDGMYVQELVGYRYDQGVSVSFKNDDEKLSEILNGLSKTDLEVEIHFSFSVSNPEKYNDKLIELATKNAKKKAEVFANSLEVQLDQIEKVEYSIPSSFYESPTRPLMAKRAMMDASNDIHISTNPDDIIASDSVTIVWSIK